MVLDKSIEVLEDLVRFLNRKQSFYFKLYDRYLEGDHNRLDDSRKHEADCDSVCGDIVECIKAISDEAQIRGIAKKPKVLCTLDGQDEEKYILDEWLLRVVRLLDSESNWNRMLAPVEGKDMNNAFDAILFRLTYVANFLKELSNKTESMRESSLKEAEITKYMACCYDPEDYFEETNYIDEDGELRCNSSGAKLFNTEDEAIEYADEIKPIGWMSFAMPFNTTLNESDYTYKAKRLKEMTQAEFNRLAKRRDEFRSQTTISPAEKNNLYADIKDFEEEFRDLQDTAERLPDSYIDQVCSTSSYPFDVAIDEVQNVEDWCSEVEEFLKDDINNWGIMKESDKTYKAKAGKKWLKGDKLVKSKASADSFESKTEPTQRLNQMKKDGKLDKDANIDVVEESIFDFAAQNQPMYRFAKQKHDATGVIRKHSGDPYWVHPEGVAKIAAAYGGTDIEIQAAMAHDTLEDTNCSYEELEEMFGDEVASIVREITNDTEEVDRLGKEQYINLELISLSHPALFVKLCDMYYNQMDFPTEAQKQRMIKNINYLLANREDDLNENEIALIEAILQTLLN